MEPRPTSKSTERSVARFEATRGDRGSSILDLETGTASNILTSSGAEARIPRIRRIARAARSLRVCAGNYRTSIAGNARTVRAIRSRGA